MIMMNLKKKNSDTCWNLHQGQILNYIVVTKRKLYNSDHY